MPPNSKRSIVYIDGFNLYYGALRGGPYKWLDLEKYFSLLRPDDNLQAIRYFTAKVNGPKRQNQRAYLRALGQRMKVDTILGKFKTTQVTCTQSSCTFAGSRVFTKPEEKRTDVNIAIRIVDDAYQDACDRFIVVSGDSDLVPPIDMVKLRFPHKEVIVYVPARHNSRGAAVELRAAADKDRTLPLNLLQHSQFPSRVPNGSGGFIDKPASW